MSPPPFRAEWTDLHALGEERESWRRLADNAIEPNPFYGPEFLLAIQRHLTPQKPIPALVVRCGEGRLAGLFPLERPFLADGLLGRAWRLLGGPFLPLTTPLVAPEAPEAIIGAALDHLAETPGPNILLVGYLPEKRFVARHLVAALNARGAECRVIRRIARAAVETTHDAKTYRVTRWNRGQRKDHTKLARHLAALGSVSTCRIAGNSPGFDAHLADFLALEAKGWKGKAGTALASAPARKAFAEAAFGGADASIAILHLNGEPLAMTLDLVSQNVGYCFKTAYDPEAARLAPGRFLDGEIIADAAGGFLERLDSCAGPGHPMERSWREREEIITLLAGLPRKGRPPALGFTDWRFRQRARLSRWINPKGYTTRKD